MEKGILLTLHVIISILFLNSLFLLPVEVSALAKADKVVVIKSKRILMLLRDGEMLKTYKIALGKQPTGHKIFAGDKRTPEGNYILDRRNMESRFHLSIHISYPNESDIFNAKKLGVSPGGIS
ncbi:MAG: L,D-transpeptidase family protein [Nitrospirota bacterium]